ncbi:MAG: hypothetical protein ACR2P7_03220 [bacterium]
MRQHKVLEWLGVTIAVLYALMIALNIGAEFYGFALLLLSAVLLGLWSHRCRHRGMFLLQFFYAATAIIGMVRWF